LAKGISRDLLIRTALHIVDRDGLDALSMRKLGAELGVDPMTAYRHLPNKEALLDGVVEAVVSEVDLEVDESLSWEDQLRQLIRADMDAMLAHPNVLPVLARRPLTTPGSLRLVELAFQIMADAGVPLYDAALAINAMGTIAINTAIDLAAWRAKPANDESARAPFLGLPRDEFPRIVEAIETGQLIESYSQILDFAMDAFIGRLERARTK
jgi:AcrR family transcriptional regulator